MMTTRRILLRAALVLPLVAVIPAGPVGAQSADDAQRFIEALTLRAITTVANKQLTQNERDELFRKLFISSFDIPEIGRFVLSRYWRTGTADQQQEFLSLFEEITVLTWAKRFQDYDGERLETLGTTKDGDRVWSVDSLILRPQGQPVSVQWRLRTADDGNFRVVDIIFEGVSMAITHRSDYGAAMQANGGRFDNLLSAMRTKLDQLRAAG